MHLSCGRGRFVRDEAGVWRYGVDGLPVHGGQDMTMTNFFNFTRRLGAGGAFVQVSRGLAMEDGSLAWVFSWDSGTGPTIDVPLDEWDKRDRVIGVWAPELKQEGGMRGLKLDAGLGDAGPEGIGEAAVAPPLPLQEEPETPASPSDGGIRKRIWSPGTGPPQQGG